MFIAKERNGNIPVGQLSNSCNQLQNKHCKAKLLLLIHFLSFNKKRTLPLGLGGSGSSYKIFSINSEKFSEKNGGLPKNKWKFISQVMQTSKLLSGAIIYNELIFLRKYLKQ